LAWLGAVCYTLQIYFDFSGYSDMAIGMGRIFGFKYLENFEHPYISSTIREFWRRWHISLTSWFRDYVYIPLGGNRRGKKRTEFNKAVVFLVTGIWHGANWTFLAWGLWHGAFMILEDIGIIPRKKLEHRAIGHVYVMLVVVLGFTMFRAADIHQGLGMIACMFTGFHFTPEGTLQILQLLGRWELFILAAAVVFSADIPAKVRQWLAKHPQAMPRAELLSYIGAVLLLVLDILNLSQTGFNPFIYFQF
ncbi:MAG: MBOAT family protein, partial [Firmicutes bacterium]|nr:MBOAT family protein [Bacillota bacterium]